MFSTSVGKGKARGGGSAVGAVERGGGGGGVEGGVKGRTDASNV